jgi:hypothetical protein
VLNHFQDRLAEFGDREPLLDALTPPLHGEQLSYRDYIAEFNRKPELFLPSAAPSSQSSPLNTVAPTPTAAPPSAARRLTSWISRKRSESRIAPR